MSWGLCLLFFPDYVASGYPFTLIQNQPQRLASLNHRRFPHMDRGFQ